MTEPRIHVSTGFNGGVSVNFRADSAAELEQLINDAAANSPTLTRLMQQVGLAVSPVLTEAQALQNVQQTFPGAVVQPQSTVGQPLPPVQQPQIIQQPQYIPQPAQQAQPVQTNQQRIPGPAGAPPNVAYPGPCAHGDRVYTDKPARGKAWRRWECNTPWTKGAQGRCEPINVEN